MSRIPPLPQPVFLWDRPEYPHFTADQLRARDRQIVEVCAKACEAVPLNGNAGVERNWYAIALRDAAAALRSLLGEGEEMSETWTRELPTTPGIYDHRNLENAGGRAPIKERKVYVGYVNWSEDMSLGHGTTPTAYMPPKLRACRIEHPMTTDSLTVQEWGGEWRRRSGDGGGQHG